MSLLAAAASEGHHLAPMIMEPIWFPVIAGAVFVFLGLVVWSFRDFANRHSTHGPITDKDQSHGAH